MDVLKLGWERVNIGILSVLLITSMHAQVSKTFDITHKVKVKEYGCAATYSHNISRIRIIKKT